MPASAPAGAGRRFLLLLRRDSFVFFFFLTEFSSCFRHQIEFQFGFFNRFQSCLRWPWTRFERVAGYCRPVVVVVVWLERFFCWKKKRLTIKRTSSCSSIGRFRLPTRTVGPDYRVVSFFFLAQKSNADNPWNRPGTRNQRTATPNGTNKTGRSDTLPRTWKRKQKTNESAHLDDVGIVVDVLAINIRVVDALDLEAIGAASAFGHCDLFATATENGGFIENRCT